MFNKVIQTINKTFPIALAPTTINAKLQEAEMKRKRKKSGLISRYYIVPGSIMK